MSTTVKPEPKFTRTTDIRLRFLEWEGDGSPIVLMHGLTVSAEYWSLTARLLAQEHRVLSVDLRGHGHSDKPGHGYDYERLAQDIDQLCEEAGVTNALIAGQSWGASVALTVGAKYPERTSHVAMVDGGFGGRRRREPGEAEPDYSQMLAPLEIYRNRGTYLAAAAASLQEVMGPEVEEILMSSVTLNEDGSVSERLSRENQTLILQQMGELNARDLYGSLQAPVLFAGALSSNPEREEWNERKRDAVRRVREIVPNARESWFPDTAHDIQIHRPQELAKELEGFLHG